MQLPTKFMSNNINNTIKDYEKFSPSNYPNVIQELSVLSQGISQISNLYKVEIIVSYLKDHCLKTEWMEANPPLTRMITSGYFDTSHVESLFASCHNNTIFLKSLEDFIENQLVTARH